MPMRLAADLVVAGRHPRVVMRVVIVAEPQAVTRLTRPNQRDRVHIEAIAPKA